MSRITESWTDASLNLAICGTPDERDAALRHLFCDKTLLNKVRQYVAHHGGKEIDGEDVFQDAFILFDRNIRQGKYNGNSTLETYFLAIVKWHWVTLHRQNKPLIEYSAHIHDEEIEDTDAQLIKDDHKKVLQDALSQLGEKCKALLLLTSNAASNEEVAQKCGYNNADAAKKEIYRCREKFRHLIKAQPNLEHILKSIIKK